MIFLHIFPEGYTESDFLNLLVKPSLEKNNFINRISISCLTTNRELNQKGGKLSYHKAKKEITAICKSKEETYVTTMFDLFKLPTDFPKYSESLSIKDPIQKAEFLEEAMRKDIGLDNFIPNITVHEFEALLFSNPSAFDIVNNKIAPQLKKALANFKSPEHINGSDATAPSKRILQVYPQYRKRADGLLVAQRIGLNTILEQCNHFRCWYNKLFQLGKDNNFSRKNLSKNRLEIV